MNSYSFNTSFGWITIKSNDSKLTYVKFGRLKNYKSSRFLINVSKQMKLYFEGKLQKFNVPYELLGSQLQIKIWSELTKIKYGYKKSYSQISDITKTSPRYVGNVCGQNNLLLIIPCHRVVRNDGSLGGFSGLGGIKLKKKLLDLESNV